MPVFTFETLDLDQAKEKFLERSKVVNQFALKAQIISQLKFGEEDDKKLEKSTRLNISHP